MDELRVETAQESDLDQLVALDARAFSKADRYIRSEWHVLLRQSLTDGEVAIFVARLRSSIVGAVVTEFNMRARELNVVSLSVDPKLRRMGLGSRLLCRALAVTPNEIDTVTLEVRPENLGARNLYRRLGFKVAGHIDHYYTDGGEAIAYRATLATVRERLAN
jgi:ribosomal protein S18 acetylase RimI-like enzyme